MVHSTHIGPLFGGLIQLSIYGVRGVLNTISIYIFMPKLFTTKVKVMMLVFCLHRPGVTGAGTCTKDRRFYLRKICEVIPAWTSPYIPLSTWT